MGYFLIPALLLIFLKAAIAQEALKTFPCNATSKNSSGAVHTDFHKNLAEFGQSFAAQHHFDPESLNCVLDQITPNAQVLKLIRPAPKGKSKNWLAYRSRFIEESRIQAGVNFWNRHEADLKRAEVQYGIPPEIIVGIIGIETMYGRYTGKFRILDALATLAFKYPDLPNKAKREAFFKQELESTLLLAQENSINPLALYGSYAGAVGLPQFMPGSIRKYAIDFDGDGKIDLKQSAADSIGSIANFLVSHGWKRNEGLVYPIEINTPCNVSPDRFLNQGLQATFSLTELKKACITSLVKIPEQQKYGLIDLQNGDLPTEYWLGTNNFFAITYYNRSYFYAMSVITLGNALREHRNASF